MAESSQAEHNAPPTALWESVNSLLALAPLPGILAHRVGPLAAHRLRRLGEPIPPPLALEARAAAVCMLLVIPLVERVRASFEGRIVLFKGPELARHYPGASRRFGDIDILVEDAQAARTGLVDGGFAEVHQLNYTPDWHQLEQTFALKNIEVGVDVHKAPHWPVGLRTPPNAAREILEASVPSALGVEGISTPAPHHNALILAAHAWSHEPLWTLQDLIDIAVVSAQADELDVERTAADWGLGRLWRTTRHTIDALFYGGRKTFPLRTWARHLEEMRDRSHIERRLTSFVHGYWGMSPRQGLVTTMRAVRHMRDPVFSEVPH
jgi:hypothetical protein